MSKYVNFLVIDSETATLPFVNEWELSTDDKKKIAIAKPLIYDIGWTVANRTQGVIKKCCYLVAEIFSVPAIFNTAYYKDKRPKYLEMIANNEAEIKPWNEIMEIFLTDLAQCKYVTAYNAMFDMKKAIPFTELYISKLYSANYYEWEEQQKTFCQRIIHERPKANEKEFDPDHFIFRGEKYPMIDIWGLACTHLLNNPKYKKQCIENGNMSASGLYFSTSAETAMRYLEQEFGFIEDHTALSDAEIETKILFTALKRGKVVQGIIYFPFKILGGTIDFIKEGKGISRELAEAVAEKIESYLPENAMDFSNFHKQTYNRLMALKDFIDEKWGE